MLGNLPQFDPNSTISFLFYNFSIFPLLRIPRIAREAATGQPSRGSLARTPATPAAPPTAAPAPGKRLKTPGKGILVRCAGEGTSLSMQATVHEARKSGSWVVVLNAGHEPDMMLTLLAALERDHSGYTHPNFRLIICLSQQSDCDLTWALTSQV